MAAGVNKKSFVYMAVSSRSSRSNKNVAAKTKKKQYKNTKTILKIPQIDFLALVLHKYDQPFLVHPLSLARSHVFSGA